MAICAICVDTDTCVCPRVCVCVSFAHLFDILWCEVLYGYLCYLCRHRCQHAKCALSQVAHQGVRGLTQVGVCVPTTR